MIHRTTLLLAIAGLLFTASPCRACFTIVVGRSVSADGCVLVAHNEDDPPPQVVNHHKVPRRIHAPGKMITLPRGGQLEQVPVTWAYLWSEMPGMDFSDSYVNEWGVCVTSDNCPSREDQGELTDGGIGCMLRRLVAQRARSAREGVRIAGSLIERFGYIASGRTYIIADSEEGWIFCAIRGKHWLARRVDDDQVAIIANTYTVREVELSDTENVAASKGILTYAIKRGWCDAEREGPFDFAAAFADPESARAPSNYGRQSIGFHYVAADPPAAGSKLPFSVAPSKKLAMADLIQVLRHTRSGRTIQAVDGQQVACDTSQAICRGSTQTSFVARLGAEPSRDLGIVYCVCLSAPETSVFIPFPFGIADFPAAYRAERKRPSHDLFERRVTAPFAPDRTQAFWAFANFRRKAERASVTWKGHFLRLATSMEAKFLAPSGPDAESQHDLGGRHGEAPTADVRGSL